METAHPGDLLSILANKLDAGGYQWMLVGSVAGLMYGRNRSTDDIDIVLDCARIDPARLSADFNPEYMLDEEMVRDSIRVGMMFNAIPWHGGPKVDLVPLKTDAFDQWCFRRRAREPWRETHVSVVRPDDLVLSKLRWAKDSMSERQLADVRAIMATGLVDEYDDDFQRWIRQLGLDAALDASRSTRYEA